MYSGFTAKLKSGPRRQFGPRRSPERFWGFHRVIGPIRPYGNTHLHLGRSWVKTGYVAHGHFCCINRYTSDTHCVTALQSYTAIQRYTALYSAIHYTAIHRYTLYNLYNTPLSSRRRPRTSSGLRRCTLLQRGKPSSPVPRSGAAAGQRPCSGVDSCSTAAPRPAPLAGVANIFRGGTINYYRYTHYTSDPRRKETVPTALTLKSHL